MDNNNDLLYWKLGQMNAAKGYAAAAKGKPSGESMSAGEIAIRAGNTVGWYDFTDATTFTNDGGGKISSWRDKLLSGHDLSAPTSGSRPLLTANGILFDASNNNYMVTDNFTYDQPMQVYAVCRQVTWTNADYLWDGTVNNAALAQFGTTPALVLYAGSSPEPSNTNMTLNVFHLIRTLCHGANSFIQIDDTAKATGNPGTGAPGGISLACARGVSALANAEYKELIFRNVADDATTYAAIADYLIAKYSL